MERIEKTVFISYRRTNRPWALAIYQNLTNHGYDVFCDFSGIASGDFESVILGNIGARAHFLVLLTPSSLEDCDKPGDWLRREIEKAMELKRNIVPLMIDLFDFNSPAVAGRLTGKLAALKGYNGLSADFQKYLDHGGGVRDGDQAEVEKMIRGLRRKIGTERTKKSGAVKTRQSKKK
jgi:hypothetical protein